MDLIPLSLACTASYPPMYSPLMMTCGIDNLSIGALGIAWNSSMCSMILFSSTWISYDFSNSETLLHQIQVDPPYTIAVLVASVIMLLFFFYCCSLFYPL